MKCVQNAFIKVKIGVSKKIENGIPIQSGRAHRWEMGQRGGQSGHRSRMQQSHNSDFRQGNRMASAQAVDQFHLPPSTNARGNRSWMRGAGSLSGAGPRCRSRYAGPSLELPSRVPGFQVLVYCPAPSPREGAHSGTGAITSLDASCIAVGMKYGPLAGQISGKRQGEPGTCFAGRVWGWPASALSPSPAERIGVRSGRTWLVECDLLATTGSPSSRQQCGPDMAGFANNSGPGK